VAAIAASRVAPPDQPVKAILLMVSSVLVFSCMDGLSKFLTADYPPVLVIWIRYVCSLALLLPLATLRWRERPLHTRRVSRHLVRGACMVGSGLFFVSGLAHLPLAQATAIGFVTPLVVTALSIPLLGEQVGIRRWLAVAVGFGGVLIIVRPGGSGFDPAALWPVLSSVAWALAMILTRLMRLAEPPLTMLTYTALVGALGMSLPALLEWQDVSLAAWGLLLVCGAFSLAGQYLQLHAFRHGPASLLAPFSYCSIIGSTAIGVVAFGNFPDLWTWIGTAIVIASGLYTWHRARVRARQAIVLTPAGGGAECAGPRRARPRW
jgi:drug/metabolite transporter (DMT)-like permease